MPEINDTEPFELEPVDKCEGCSALDCSECIEDEEGHPTEYSLHTEDAE